MATLNKAQHKELHKILVLSFHAIKHPPPSGHDGDLTAECLEDWRQQAFENYRVEGTTYHRTNYVLASIQQILESGEEGDDQCANPSCECGGSCAANWPEPPTIVAPRLADKSKAAQVHDPKMSDCPNGATFNINQRILWSPGLLGASVPGRVSALIPVTDGAPTYQIRLDHVADKPDTKPGPLIDVPQDGTNGTLVEEPTTQGDTE